MLKKIYKYFINNDYVIKNITKLVTFKTLEIEELKLMNRNKIYEYFHNYFYIKSKSYIKKHRFYFRSEKRGYGEDAFHAMWEFLIKTYKPKSILEIGVYRGQTLSLFNLICIKEKIKSEIFGITPLNDSDDSVSNYLKIDYVVDINEHFKHFNLEKPNILKALSTDQKAINFINSKKWDLVYIDGSHEYDVVKADIVNVVSNLAKGGLLVLDDSSLFEDFEDDKFTFPVFKGHPGPSRAFQEIMSEGNLSYLIGVGHNNIFINTKNNS